MNQRMSALVEVIAITCYEDVAFLNRVGRVILVRLTPMAQLLGSNNPSTR